MQCNTDAQCAERALTELGSSAAAFCPPAVDIDTYAGTFKLLSNNASVNPQAWNWTRIYLPYVDGGSQTGDLSAPVPVAGSDRLIYYRGARLHRWTVAELLENEGLARATDVLLAGGSAGALATFLHADSWRDALPPAAKLVAMPDSGFFLDYNATTGGPAFGADMRWIFARMNSTGGVPAACVAAHAADPALCIFAENVAPTLRTPTFALQSTYDAFQVTDIAHLAPANASAINAYGRALEARLVEALLGSSALHGVFLGSCYHHVGEWGEIVIDGQDQAAALQQFYAGVGKAGAKREWRQGRAYPCAACCQGGGGARQ